jgi:hypothetical protein
MMLEEVILDQSLGKYISNLVFPVNREDLDTSRKYMFVKMMVANIYVFGPRT